jgi:hypothetical protein
MTCKGKIIGDWIVTGAIIISVLGGEVNNLLGYTLKSLKEFPVQHLTRIGTLPDKREKTGGLG